MTLLSTAQFLQRSDPSNWNAACLNNRYILRLFFPTAKTAKFNYANNVEPSVTLNNHEEHVFSQPNLCFFFGVSFFFTVSDDFITLFCANLSIAMSSCIRHQCYQQWRCRNWGVSFWLCVEHICYYACMCVCALLGYCWCELKWCIALVVVVATMLVSWLALPTWRQEIVSTYSFKMFAALFHTPHVSQSVNTCKRTRAHDYKHIHIKILLRHMEHAGLVGPSASHT